MSDTDLPHRPGRAFRLLDRGLILLLALAFKAFYSKADATQLQWLLHPLAWLLNLIGGFNFQLTGAGDWLDTHRGLIIIKACSGGNFLIASWLGYLWRWREQPLGMVNLLRASGAAWLTTLLANSLRILLIAHGQENLAQMTGLSAMDSHRLIGIVVYFGVLTVQMAGARTLLAAPVIYLGVVVLAPWAHAMLSGRNGISISHVVWVAGIPMASILSYGVWRLGRHFLQVRPARPISVKDDRP